MRNRVKDNQGNVLANVPTMKRVSTLRILAPFTSFIKSSSPLSDFFSFSCKPFKQVLQWAIFMKHRVASSIFLIVHFLVHPNLDLVSSHLALFFAARNVAQMTIEIVQCYHNA